MQARGEKPVLACQLQKARVEAHPSPFPFGHGAGEVVEEHLASDALHEAEGVDVAAGKGLEALAVSELQIKPPAVALH